MTTTLKYKGTRDPKTGRVQVQVEGQEPTPQGVTLVLMTLDPRFDLFRHSPDGFEFGYSGSGPAQLALAILCDFFVRRPEVCDDVIDASVATYARRADLAAIKLHQEFKARAIAPIDHNAPGFTLSIVDVEQHVRALVAEKKARVSAARSRPLHGEDGEEYVLGNAERRGGRGRE